MVESSCRSGVCRLLSVGSLIAGVIEIVVVVVVGCIAEGWNSGLEIVDDDAIM